MARKATRNLLKSLFRKILPLTSHIYRAGPEVNISHFYTASHGIATHCWPSSISRKSNFTEKIAPAVGMSMADRSSFCQVNLSTGSGHPEHPCSWDTSAPCCLADMPWAAFGSSRMLTSPMAGSTSSTGLCARIDTHHPTDQGSHAKTHTTQTEHDQGQREGTFGQHANSRRNQSRETCASAAIGFVNRS